MSTVIYDTEHAIVVDVPAGVVTKQFVDGTGITVIDEVVISHFHRDHCGSLDVLLAPEYPVTVGRVWMADYPSRDTLHIERIKAAFSARRSQGRPVARGFPHSEAEPIRLTDGYAVEFVGPHHEERLTRPDGNPNSAVVRLSRDGRGLLLLPGDLTLDGLERIRRVDAARLAADWLVFPHHGGLISSPRRMAEAADAFLAAVDPKTVVLTYSRNDGELVPRHEVIAALRARYPDTKFVCTQLSTRCSTGLRSAEFHHPVSAGLRGGACCAGTIVLTAGDELAWASGDSHAEFVSSEVGDTRMCKG
jgi:beta-lactamase superfamily II metal-dependent hydrolase